MQFNVVDRATLLDAQKHPEKYSGLVVRVAGYSALFTTLSKSLQDDIIRRTEQGLEMRFTHMQDGAGAVGCISRICGTK